MRMSQDQRSANVGVHGPSITDAAHVPAKPVPTMVNHAFHIVGIVVPNILMRRPCDKHKRWGRSVRAGTATSEADGRRPLTVG
jgi:hypothetical protein